MGGGSADNRRRKAALLLLACVAVGALPHGLVPWARLVPGLGMALVLGGSVARTLFLKPPPPDPSLPNAQVAGSPSSPFPLVDVVVAARDEEAVIGSLVDRVLRLRWPADGLRLWVVDDGSEDGTPSCAPCAAAVIPEGASRAL
jgi:1,2-diacylglycerol 3-beta-glucosyltransferase